MMIDLIISLTCLGLAVILSFILFVVEPDKLIEGDKDTRMRYILWRIERSMRRGRHARRRIHPYMWWCDIPRRKHAL